MYTKAASRIKVSGNQCTVAFPCQKGVRQGQLQSVLGGNNGGVLLKDSVMNTLMFADDIVLLSTSAEGLRRHLSSLESLSKELKMEVNTAKTKISVIGRNTNNEPFYWKGATLERVEAYKYLGVWITTDGNYIWESITLKLFDTMVLPILSYGAEIWGFMEDSNLEAVELHYLKHILHVPLTASNIAVRGELGQLPIHLIWNIEILG